MTTALRDCTIGFGQAVLCIALTALVSWAIGVWAAQALCVTDPAPHTEIFGVRLVFGSLALALLATVALSVFAVSELVSRFFIRMAQRHDGDDSERQRDHRFFRVVLRIGVYLSVFMVMLTATCTVALNTVPCFSVRFTLISWTGACLALLVYGTGRVCKSLRTEQIPLTRV